jgi:hypothetical protein
MTLANLAKKKGFTIMEYQNLKHNINAVCDGIIQQIPDSKKDNGMYYPIADILPHNTDRELLPYYIQSLKLKGVEFRENNTLWRI